MKMRINIIAFLLGCAICAGALAQQSNVSDEARKMADFLNSWRSSNEVGTAGEKAPNKESPPGAVSNGSGQKDTAQNQVTHDASISLRLMDLGAPGLSAAEKAFKCYFHFTQAEIEGKAGHWQHAAQYLGTVVEHCDLPDAEFAMSQLYARGLGVEIDVSKAEHWLRSAAERGHASAQYLLGQAYFDGSLVAKDEKEAFSWWQKAADQAQPDASYRIGIAYIQALGGRPRKPELSKKYLHAAAANEHAQAQYALGHFYLTGEFGNTEPAAAAEWLTKAAVAGIDNAQYEIGAMMIQGKGVAKNEAGGIRWVAKAAEQGHSQAQYNLGIALLQGMASLPKNVEQARIWLEKAASQNNAQAKAVLDQL